MPGLKKKRYADILSGPSLPEALKLLSGHAPLAFERRSGEALEGRRGRLDLRAAEPGRPPEHAILLRLSLPVTVWGWPFLRRVNAVRICFDRHGVPAEWEEASELDV